MSKMFVRLLVLVMQLCPDMYIPHSFVILHHQHRSSHSPLSFIVHEVFVQVFTLVRMPLISHSEVLNEWTKWTTWSTSCQWMWTNEVIHSDEAKITSLFMTNLSPMRKLSLFHTLRNYNFIAGTIASVNGTMFTNHNNHLVMSQNKLLKNCTRSISIFGRMKEIILNFQWNLPSKTWEWDDQTLKTSSCEITFQVLRHVSVAIVTNV